MALYACGEEDLVFAGQAEKNSTYRCLDCFAPIKRHGEAIARQHVRAKVRVFASYNNMAENITRGEVGLLVLKTHIAGVLDALNKKCLTCIVEFPYYK